MRTRNALVLTVAVAMLTGCATVATAYQPFGLTGGFSETQLSQNAYEVRFVGNGFTSSERASDFSLLRAAELCLGSGYRYFVVADADSETATSTVTMPTQSVTNTTGTAVGGSIQATSTTTTTGGQTFRISKPRHTTMVVFYLTPPDDAGFVYDATFIGTSLRQKYALPPMASPVTEP